MFIEAFGLYRNMYRTILSWSKRERRANVLLLALGSHEENLGDVIAIIEPELSILDSGIQVEINGQT